MLGVEYPTHEQLLNKKLIVLFLQSFCLQHPVANGGSTAIDYYLPDIINTTDYYVFGAPMPGRKYHAAEYRYGFNGKENDLETTAAGDGLQDYGMRIYNPSLGRFLSVDPLADSYPWYTPYQFAGNMPIWAIDLDGLEEAKVTDTYNKQSNKTIRYLELTGKTKPEDIGKIQFNYSDGTSEIIDNNNKMYSAAIDIMKKSLTDDDVNTTYKYKYEIEGSTTVMKKSNARVTQSNINQPTSNARARSNTNSPIIPPFKNESYDIFEMQGETTRRDKDFYDFVGDLMIYLYQNPQANITLVIPGQYVEKGGEFGKNYNDPIIPGKFNGKTYNDRVIEKYNLIINAIKAMSKGKLDETRVHLETGPIEGQNTIVKPESNPSFKD